ncbi:MAG: anti-sigma factor family protein [Gemmatimonadota bacterium]
MSHLSETQLLSYLDGELSQKASEEVAAHLGECGECRASLEALRQAARHFSAAVSLLDVEAEVPRTIPEGPRPRRVRPPRPWRTLARAAVLVLALAGVASAVIPGSPVRSWVAALHLGGKEEAPIVPTVGREEPAPEGERGPAGVSVLPDAGVLRILLTNFAPESSVRVRLVDGAEAHVEVGEDAEARFRIGPGRIEVSGSGRGDLVVDLPRSALEATVEVEGRIAVMKKGKQLRLLRPAVDSLQGDVRFRIGP